MIRVRIDVDGYGHEFSITREEEFVADTLVTERLHKLIVEAETSMRAALKAVPE